MENNNGLIFLESVNPLQIKNSTIEDTKFGEKVTKNVFKIGLDNLQSKFSDYIKKQTYKTFSNRTISQIYNVTFSRLLNT